MSEVIFMAWISKAFEKHTVENVLSLSPKYPMPSPEVAMWRTHSLQIDVFKVES